ncbi:MAG: hypothetical protein WCK67_04190 [bacterium]
MIKLNKNIWILSVFLIFITTITSAYSILDNFYSNTPDKTLVTKQLGDFSVLPKNYKLIKYVNLFGVSAVFAENNQNKQKIGIINPGSFLVVSKQNIENNIIDQQLNNLNSQIPFQLVNLQNLNIIKKGSFNVNQQKVPYIKINVQLAGFVNCKIEGILGVIEAKNKKNNFIFAVNNPGEYNQNMTESFIKSTAK